MVEASSPIRSVVDDVQAQDVVDHALEQLARVAGQCSNQWWALQDTEPGHVGRQQISHADTRIVAILDASEATAERLGLYMGGAAVPPGEDATGAPGPRPPPAAVADRSAQGTQP